MCSVGHAQCLVVKKGWSLAVLAIGSVGRQQCWPSAVLATGGVGRRRCWAVRVGLKNTIKIKTVLATGSVGRGQWLATGRCVLA